VVGLRGEVTEPHPQRAEIYEEYYEVYRSLYARQKDAMHRLTRLVSAGKKGLS
jgi:xylulokinase